MTTNKLFVIYGPSGSGQDSIIEGVAKDIPVERVITTTTRPMRPDETQKNPYWFVSKDHFEKAVSNHSFIEWAKTYNGEWYGVSHDEIERIASSGKIGIWKVDWQGAKSIRALFPAVPIIYITAPIENISKRLRKRDTATEAYFQERMEYIEDLLNRSDLVYDYKIENNDGGLEQAIGNVEEIIRKHDSESKAG